MSGKHSGVARVENKAKHAFYVHCNAHCLNLILVDSVKSVPEAECFFALLQRLYVYMPGSCVHQKWLPVQKDMYPGAPRELQRLRACRYQACRNLVDRPPAVLRALHELASENSGERSVDPQDLLTQIDLTFIDLVVFKKILGEAKLLSDMLQAPSLDLAKAVDLIEALQDTLQECRCASSFDELWTDAVDTAKQCNVAVETVERQSLKVSSRLGGLIVESSVGQRRCKEGDKDKFRRHILPNFGSCEWGDEETFQQTKL